MDGWAVHGHIIHQLFDAKSDSPNRVIHRYTSLYIVILTLFIFTCDNVGPPPIGKIFVIQFTNYYLVYYSYSFFCDGRNELQL